MTSPSQRKWQTWLPLVAVLAGAIALAVASILIIEHR